MLQQAKETLRNISELIFEFPKDGGIVTGLLEMFDFVKNQKLLLRILINIVMTISDIATELLYQKRRPLLIAFKPLMKFETYQRFEENHPKVVSISG